MATSSVHDDVIVGGGIIGLSIAYELAKRGRSVAVLEKQQLGAKASWAGAGILPPANGATAIHPQEQLEAVSSELHSQWSGELKQATGIDNGYLECGGLYVARTAGEVAALNGMELEWQQRQIDFQRADDQPLSKRSPLLSRPNHSPNEPFIRKATWVPGESQISNPQHLDALVSACRRMNVALYDQLGETRIEFAAGQAIECVATENERFVGNSFVFAAGPWTQQLVEPIGVELPMQPVRGQIVLYKVAGGGYAPGACSIVNEGSRYLVPRLDGHVLAGATIEEVGFECRTTRQEIAGLRQWAEGISDALGESTYRKSWAGLRPGTYDGFPYLGRLGEYQNAFVATGHFKCGLHLSTGTALAIADLIEGKPSEIDLQPFSPARASRHQSIDNRQTSLDSTVNRDTRIS